MATGGSKDPLMSGNMVSAETELLSQVAAEIREFVPAGVAVIDLGPGTPTAFRNKTKRILEVLGSKTCALVDDSVAFLRAIAEQRENGLGPRISRGP